MPKDIILILISNQKGKTHLKRDPSTCNHGIPISSTSMCWGCREVCSTITLKQNRRFHLFVNKWNKKKNQRQTSTRKLLPLWPKLLKQLGNDVVFHPPYSRQSLLGKCLHIQYRKKLVNFTINQDKKKNFHHWMLV